MQLIVWNSQGASQGGAAAGRWDVLWTNWVTPRISPQSDDVVALTVESGWAPWIQSGELSLNHVYPLDIDSTRYDAAGAAKSVFCQGVEEARRRWAYWIPWVGNLDAFKTNTRCSMGGLVLPYRSRLTGIERFEFQGHIRPVVRTQMATGKTTDISVFLVHLLSGYWKKASDELFNVTGQMAQLIPEGTAGIIVGDMNIDLLTIDITLPRNWTILNVGVATQKSGGELDYALLYDPNQQFSQPSASVLQKFKSGANGSDHSVMAYTL